MHESSASEGASGIVVRQPSADTLAALGVWGWPVWSKEVSVFDWHYDETETCYLLAGEVEVTSSHGEPVQFGAGDLVTFPAGLSCRWQVRSPVQKHYRFSN
ncbi:MAG: cupin domain-containing protein [Oscillatoriales cyanobacterium SM2_1_8]|nr:cupin domain-containing protein [Oscillatoriales cyanobacterium SM2_1_8]